MMIRPGRLVPGSLPRVAEFRNGEVSVFPLASLGPVEPGVDGDVSDVPVPPEEDGEEASRLPAVEEGVDEAPVGPGLEGFGPAGIVGCPPDPTAYWAVYSSIPFIRSEYEANPSYRHEATMEILFGQLRPTVVQRVQVPPPLPPPPVIVPPWYGLPPGHWLTYRFWPPPWGVWW